MGAVRTGFGGELSIERAAVVVAIASSALLFAMFLLLGRNIWLSLFEVVLGGIVVGSAYYAGLRRRFR